MGEAPITASAFSRTPPRRDGRGAGPSGSSRK